MKLQKFNFLLLKIVLLLGTVAASECVWAATGGCAYTQSGTGMGGTGARPEDEVPQPAGNVIFSRGSVEAQSMGRSRPLTKGDQVCVGETIATAESGMVQIRMLDSGMVSVRPDTKLRIDAFQFNGKEDGSERSALYLVQGAFRAVTGLIGHLNKENYKIKTPTATIGIKGTDHEPMFIPNPAPGQVAQGVPGTYDKVNSGGVFIQTLTGSIDVKPNQIGFAPLVPIAPPSILKEVPRFYRVDSGVEKSRASESAGGKSDSKDASGNQHRHEHGSVSGVHAPALHVPDVRTSESQSPDMHAPDNQAHEGHAPVVQAPVMQAPAIQTPAAQAPVIQTPAVQAPGIEPPER
jgi:hypothetical protein